MKNLQSYSNRRQIIFWMIFLLMIIFSLPVFSQDPVADFTADQTSGCPEMVVIFTDQSVNAEKWTWYHRNEINRRGCFYRYRTKKKIYCMGNAI